MATTRRTMQGERVLAAAIALIVVELIWAPGHAALTSVATDLMARWSSSSVQLWPMHAWKAVLDAVGIPTTRATGLGSVLALLLGLPLLIVGGLVLEAVWFPLYVAGALGLGSFALAVKVHLVPTFAAAALACVALPGWREYFFPIHVAPVVTRPTASVAVVAPPTAPPPPGPPRLTAAGGPPAGAIVAGRGARLCTMGPELAHLADRRDALTRNGFEPGERFILCGGACGRPYKIVSCEFLQYRCPRDGSSLYPVTDDAVSGAAHPMRPHEDHN